VTTILRTRMEVATFNDPAALDALEPEWDALADAAGAPCWWRAGWVRAWTRSFGRGRLNLITLRRDGELAAIVPLERLGSELRSTTNYHTPSFGLLARDEQSRRDLAEALLNLGARRLSIGFLPASQPSLAVLDSAAVAVGRRRNTRVLERCPYVIPDGDFAGYLAKRRGHLARELRRRERRLRARGDFTFEVLEGSDDLPRLIRQGFAVEAASWKGDRGSAVASSGATRTFYDTIGQWLSARGALRLAFLRLDGEAFAFDFAIEEGGVHSLLKTGYDPAFRAEGPGMLLRAKMLERAFSLGLRRYDFLGFDDPWKRAWTTLVDDQVMFQAFRGPVGLGDWAAQRYLRPVARRILKR
jgi:CelD/BcsL family acetyltransferase involved in cellulose biosynthesis